MNVLGVIVKALPQNMNSVAEALKASNLCDVFAAENGKIIITVEGADDSEALGKLREIEKFANVLSTDLIHIASESDASTIEGVDLEALSSEEDAKKILYGGSVHNWMAKHSS